MCPAMDAEQPGNPSTTEAPVANDLTSSHQSSPACHVSPSTNEPSDTVPISHPKQPPILPVNNVSAAQDASDVGDEAPDPLTLTAASKSGSSSSEKSSDGSSSESGESSAPEHGDQTVMNGNQMDETRSGAESLRDGAKVEVAVEDVGDAKVTFEGELNGDGGGMVGDAPLQHGEDSTAPTGACDAAETVNGAGVAVEFGIDGDVEMQSAGGAAAESGASKADRLRGWLGKPYPSMLESAAGVWRRMAIDNPERAGEGFSLSELVETADANWDVYMWPHDRSNAWTKMLNRSFRQGGVRGRGVLFSLHNGGTLFKLKPEYVTAESHAFLRHGSAEWKAMCEASGRTENWSPSSRPQPAPKQRKVATLSEKKGSKKASAVEQKRKRPRKAAIDPAVPAAGQDEVPMPEAESYAPAANIPQEWFDVAPGPVRLSPFDKGTDLTFPPDVHGLSGYQVVGHKGFRSIRATHGVCEGDYYFEATVLQYSGDGAVRVGWSTRRADAETPVGYNETSYGLRDRTGHFVHGSRLFEYGESFTCGDVIGCRIHLPPSVSKDVKAEIAEADKAWLTYRFVLYLQGKEPPNTNAKLPGAFVEFFKNGKSQGIPLPFCGGDENAVAKRDVCNDYVTAGSYYPTISLFRAGAVRINFGPDFKHALPIGSKPFCEVAPPPLEPEPTNSACPADEGRAGDCPDRVDELQGSEVQKNSRGDERTPPEIEVIRTNNDADGQLTTSQAANTANSLPREVAAESGQ